MFSGQYKKSRLYSGILQIRASLQNSALYRSCSRHQNLELDGSVILKLFSKVRGYVLSRYLFYSNSWALRFFGGSFAGRTKSTVVFRHCLLLFFFLIPMEYVFGSVKYGQFFVTPFKLLGLLVFVTWFFNLLAGRVRLNFDVLGLYIMVFMLVGMISALFSEYSGYSFAVFSSFLLFFPLYLIIVSSVRDVRFLHKVILVLVVSGFLTSVIGVLKYSGFVPMAASSGTNVRSTGLLGNANEFGALMLCLLPFALVLYSNEKSLFLKLFFGLNMALINLSLFLSASRAVLFPYILIVLLLVFWKRRGSVFLIGVLAALSLLIAQTLLSRIDSSELSRSIYLRMLLIDDTFDAF